MKKSLIALAVAGAFVAPVAMADVTIYGQANVSVDQLNNGRVTNAQGAFHIASDQSRIGFKGAEDLGDGLSAIWQLEQQINFDTSATTASSALTGSGGANTLGGRDTFAGLSSASMGTVILGQHDTPYKMATRGLDVFADNVADNRSLMGQISVNTVAGGYGYTTNDARLGNVIAYIAPAMSNVTLAVAYVAGAELSAGLAAATNVVNKGSASSLAAIYADGPIKASLSYQSITVGDTGTGTLSITNAAALGTGDKLTAWKLGGGYTFDAFQVNAIYEKNSSTIAAFTVDQSAQTKFYLAGKYSFGSDAVKAAYTRAGNLGNGTNNGAKQFSLGYDHSLSKRTSVYALYTKLTNDTTGNYGLTGASTATDRKSVV